MNSMDSLFQALASQPRRLMLDLVRERPGITVGEVSEQFEMSRIGVLKHLNVLEGAGLLISDKQGRTRHLHFNLIPIQQAYDRWTSDYSELWASRMTRLKYSIEAQTTDEVEAIDQEPSARQPQSREPCTNIPTEPRTKKLP